MTTISRQMQASESWTHIKSVKFCLKHTWSIEDFSYKINKEVKPETEAFFVQSAPFSPPDNAKLQFRLKMYPCDYNDENKDYVALFLDLVKCEKKEVQVKYTFAILKADGQAFFSRTGIHNFTELDKRGWREFIKREELQRKASEALPGDVLTIQCNVEVIYARVVESGPDINERMQQLTGECVNQLTEDLLALLDLSSDKTSDVILVVDGKELPAHKLILSARSSVFKAMFESDCKESNEGKVEITDVDLEAFEEFLRFLYTGKVTVDENGLDLLEIADKYATESLKSLCEEYLSLKLTIETVVPILVKADMHFAENLKKKAIQFILSNISTLVEIENWDAALEERPKLCLEVIRQIAKASKPMNEK